MPSRAGGRPWWTVAALLLAAGCATGSATVPTAVAPSLVETKRQVNEYVDSGRYEADVAVVVEQASAYLGAACC